MAPKVDSTEAIVLNFVNEQNRPLNSQNAADALQKYGLKKTAVQKALDTLAESAQISFKEYGKQKIYIARQDQFSIPDTNELDQMKRENGELQKLLEAEKNAINEVESEIRALESNLTLEQIREKEIELRDEVCAMESKLSILREGTVLVKPEERKKVQDTYNEKINQWRRRQRAFKELWGTITENMPKDLKEFKEELGIETDEDVGVSFKAYSEYTSNKSSRRI
ncbi:hypothetical protein SUGI_0789750 [Cryptomeria japonica]|uniref:homologous-pairing protein 2 homolog n=1 Tax=Cryptomeria japonica TaxID=3369 RepID=UPI0024148A24|nr:homologous-pairing protein 2 homolog [Cryptomeria japonica]GLJ38737.1 hypothetical protein SUGI_0789750 [Cryptomeria japonica]